MLIQTKIWTEESNRELSESAIREHYGVEINKYKISKKVYSINAKRTGTMLPGTCIGLEGKCKFTFDDVTVIVEQGKLAELPGGSYTFEALDNTKCVVMMVWELHWPQLR